MTGPLGEEVIVLLDFQFFRETNVLNMAFIGISTAFSFAYYCTQYYVCTTYYKNKQDCKDSVFQFAPNNNPITP